MERGLNEAIPEAMRIRLRRHMPPATPYTFTHGDLTNANIMVENGFLTGIVDWETAGYFPVWWEYVCTLVADIEKDRTERGDTTIILPPACYFLAWICPAEITQ